MKRYILAVFTLSLYALTLFIAFNIHEQFKILKERQKINITKLYNLSKEEIIKMIQERQERQKECPFTNILLLAISSSLFTGSLVTYFFLEKELKTKRNVRKLLELLPEDERKIIEKLLEKDYILQSEISEELGKVKAHRVIKKLEERGIIERSKHGKTYIIRLKKEYKQLLS